MAKKTRRSARKATSSRKAKRARPTPSKKRAGAKRRVSAQSRVSRRKTVRTKTSKAKRKAPAVRRAKPRRGGTGREETLAQTPETGRLRRGPTNPMPTKRSTGTPSGAGTIRAGARSRTSSASAARGRRDRAQPSLEPGPEPADSLGSEIRATGAPRIPARASRNQSRTDGGRRRRRLGRCLFSRGRGAWRGQPDSRSGSRRRHWQGARRGVPGQRAAQGCRQTGRARSSSLGARSRVV